MFRSMLRSQYQPRNYRRGAYVMFAGAGGALALKSSQVDTEFQPFALSSYTEPVRFSAIATARSSRVVLGALLCFKDYRAAIANDPNNLSACHTKCAKRMLKVLETNGGIYIKLGQHVAAMSYLLPIEWCETMMVLEDKCPPTTTEDLETMFRNDTGLEITEMFSEFDVVPIGVASLAQVHRAKLRHNGQEVAVKLQHPTLKEFSAIDLDTTRFSFELIKKFFPEFSLMWLSEEMDISLPQELDFRIEGENAMRTRKHFLGLKKSSLYVPEVIQAYPRILIMEFIHGTRVDNLRYLEKNNIDRNQVSAELARCFNEMIFFAPALHCDPHGGNVFIRPRPKNSASSYNFEIVLLDHGLYREIPWSLRKSYAHLWLAIIAKDDAAMRKYSYEVAGVGDDQYALFASAITGRDFASLQQGISKVPRSSDELKRINTAVGQGLLQQLVGLLASVPRILLLLLKTNDLTRHLDESLQTSSGPERPFIILAQACNRVVYQEECENAKHRGWLGYVIGRIAALIHFWPRYMYLAAGEFYYAQLTKRSNKSIHPSETALPAVAGAA